MKPILLIVFVFTLVTAHAQTTEDSVKAIVNQLFDGMRNSDAAQITGAFADEAILQTISNKDGKISVVNEKLADFAQAISNIKKGDADERITFETIKIDGDLAIVWAPYKFYYKTQYSHCGVDSFQLVRINGKWKIQYLIDTRRKDCSN